VEAGLVKTALAGPGLHVTFEDTAAEELSEVPEGQGAAEEEEEDVVEMLPMWRTRRKSRCGGRRASTQLCPDSPGRGSRNSRGSLVKQGDFDRGNDQALWRRLLSKLVLKPNCPQRLAWDALGLLLITYDCITMPLQVFETSPTPFTWAVAWLATGYWTADVPGSFLVGFHCDGIVEMRLEKIAAHYARTWLFVDVSLVAVDWTAVLVAILGRDDQTSEGGLSVLRVGKLVKFLRLVRLLRLYKAHGVLNAFIERVQSEWCLIMIGILKLLLFIMLTNHVIACTWYGIATWLESPAGASWVGANGLDGEDIWYCYLTSLHWSLTQFTPASMEVVPRNSFERLFAVCIITFAMVTFSSFVSAITNAMTQLRNLNHERNEQFSALRRYFGENHVSSSLTGRIWGCLQKAIGRSRRRMHVEDVAILQLLPWTLKTELQEEVYTPIMAAHPLFHAYGSEFKMQMRKIYQNATEEVSLGVGQELFNSGQAADRMFFVISGTLTYRHEDRGGGSSLELVSFAEAGQWLCEPVLWIRWRHAGQLIAATHCELLALRAARLQEVLVQDEPVKRYAKLFVRYFKRNPEMLSDTWADEELLQEMASRAFFDGDDDAESAYASAMSFAEGLLGDATASDPVVPGECPGPDGSRRSRLERRASFAGTSRLERRPSQVNLMASLFGRRGSSALAPQADSRSRRPRSPRRRPATPRPARPRRAPAGRRRRPTRGGVSRCSPWRGRTTRTLSTTARRHQRARRCATPMTAAGR